MNGRSHFQALASRFVFRFGSFFAFWAKGAVFVLPVLALFTVPSAQVAGAQPENALLAARVGEYVERYYMRAQALVAIETVTIQPLSRRLRDEGPPRRIVNELRVEWDGQSTSQPGAMREVMSATGPRLGPPGRPDCLDPRPFSLEPLAFLLPSRQRKVRLTVKRIETIDGVRARRIDYEPVAPDPPRVEWDGQCGHIISPGRMRGRVWVEPGSGAVLRFQQQLVGNLDLPGPRNPGAEEPLRFTAERMDTTIDYRPVTFTDPEETLLLPARVESLTVIRNSAVPRVRVTRTFAGYRRFLTAARIVP